MEQGTPVFQIFGYKFTIPSYQRDYTWTGKNFMDLREDLQEAIESENPQSHFLGTIVVAPNHENSQKFDIIDGQQRLTTIFMLLYALVHRGKWENERMRRDTEALLIDAETQKFRLEVIPENELYFKELLEQAEKGNNVNLGKPEKANTQGKNNLYEVFQSILDMIDSLNKNPQNIVKYTKALKSMTMIQFKEQNAGKAIRTFQSVNDRGVPLKLLDKLKSLLIYYSNYHCEGNKKDLLIDGQEISLDEKINKDFGEIFRIYTKIKEHKYFANFNNIGESDIFRYHAGSIKFNDILIGDYKLGNDKTYEKFKKTLKEFPKNSLKEFLKSYSSDLKIFYQTFLDMLNEIDVSAEIFKLLLIAKIKPYFYNSLLRLKIDNALDAKLITLFVKADMLFFNSGSDKRAEAFNFIGNYLENNSNINLENYIINKCKECHNINSYIGSLINNNFEIEGFHYIFFERDCKNMNIGELQKLLQSDKKGKSRIIMQEKEHIIPKNILENKEVSRAKELGFGSTTINALDDLQNHINNYGNLLSLEKKYNAEAKNLNLLQKSEVYKKSENPFIRQFGQSDTINFNKNTIIKRNKELKEWLENDFFRDFL